MTKPNVECLSCGNPFTSKKNIKADLSKHKPQCPACGARECKSLKSK